MRPIAVDALAAALWERWAKRTTVCEPYTGRPLHRIGTWEEVTHVSREGWKTEARELIAIASKRG